MPEEKETNSASVLAPSAGSGAAGADNAPVVSSPAVPHKTKAAPKGQAKGKTKKDSDTITIQLNATKSITVDKSEAKKMNLPRPYEQLETVG